MAHSVYYEQLREINNRLETLYEYLIDDPDASVTIRDVRAFMGLNDKCAGYNARIKREIFSTAPRKASN